MAKYKVVLEDGTEEMIDAETQEDLYEILEDEMMAAMVVSIWLLCKRRPDYDEPPRKESER